MSMCDLGKANNCTLMEAEANQQGKQKQTIKPLTKKDHTSTTHYPTLPLAHLVRPMASRSSKNLSFSKFLVKMSAMLLCVET